MSCSVFIGMPVYNGEAFIRQALDCLIGQSFSDWKLLIADNCSQDQTFEICSEYAAKDSRITVIRHEQNIGAAKNFKYVLDCADGKYFMWAACDDYWAPGFIEKCVAFLENSPETGMVFSNLFVFDQSGQKKLWELDLSCLSSQVPKKAFFKVLFDYDRNGKPNLIYSIYRLDVVKTAFSKYPLENTWGSDMIFVANAVRIKGLKVLEECLFGKRLIEKPSDKKKSFYESCLELKMCVSSSKTGVSFSPFAVTPAE